MATIRRGHWDPTTQLVSSDGILVCPVCKKEYRNNHIFQCPDGHLFCENCDKGTSCITCKKPISHKIRNRQLEHISQLEILPIIGAITEIPKPNPAVPGKALLPTCDYCQVSNLTVWYKCLECTSNLVICEECMEGGEGSHGDTFHCDQHPVMRITSPDQDRLATKLAQEHRKVQEITTKAQKKARSLPLPRPRISRRKN